jgi:hypothetical protein
MQIRHSQHLHFPMDKKEKKISYQVLSFCAVNGLEKFIITDYLKEKKRLPFSI